METTRRAPSPIAHDLTETPQRIARLYARVLDLADVGTEDDFFALGGNSLSAIKLLELIGDEFGVQVPIKVFYRATVVRELAGEVRTIAVGG